jgi:hypothetical protein
MKTEETITNKLKRVISNKIGANSERRKFIYLLGELDV